MNTKKLKLKDFSFDLPEELIAQKPARPRDHSRLLILDKRTGKIEHKHFFDVADYLEKGDVLVLNDTKVFPARLIGKKIPSGGKIEVFLLKETQASRTSGKKPQSSSWLCLVGGRKHEDQPIGFDLGLKGVLTENHHDGTWTVVFNKSSDRTRKIIERIGRTPLPPYIKRSDLRKADIADYQTVYADEKKAGSVAAPTAGMHFTKKLLSKLKAKGVVIEYITLHVGLGTFLPVKCEDITRHKMHEEWVEVKKPVWEKIIKAKSEGGRIVAVGTTSVRALETAFGEVRSLKSEVRRNAKKNHGNELQTSDFRLQTSIFIYPGYEFRVVDAMITNFHLPQSSLLMLVSAFAGKKKIDAAYRSAIAGKYRFYSYGDSMFIK